MNRALLTTTIEIIGGLLVVAGVALWSIPGALIVAGVLLIAAGGLSA